LECLPDGLCQDICALNCQNKECGIDGCGGWCGLCEGDQMCTDEGQCVNDCEPDCEGKECGGNGCSGSCGLCPEGSYCGADGTCGQDCEPACGLKECGDDGCGGSCGDCAGDIMCTVAGICGGVCSDCLYWPECFDIDFSAGSLSSWSIDAAMLLPKLGSTLPPTGDYMLKLTTGEGLTSEASLANFQNCLPQGNYGVAVSWRLYSEEFIEYCGSSFQDEMTVKVIQGGDETIIVSNTIDTLCPPEECLECGANYVGLTPSDVGFDQGGAYNTPWVTSTATFDTDDGELFTVELFLTDAGDSVFDTVLLVDHVQFVACDQECDLVECGPGPCGGDCGECAADGLCISGSCCTPGCDGKECGDDGCGGDCGKCKCGEECQPGGQCKFIACDSKDCGDDGCGGSCGECACGEVCDWDGTCEYVACLGKECGDDGCGDTCGTCPDMKECNAVGLCICLEQYMPCEGMCCETGELCFDGGCCLPDCDGKECSGDGCGGSCGSCNDDDPCTMDKCADSLCEHTYICCETADECDDGDDICTVDECVGGFCKHTSTGAPGCCTKPFFYDNFSTDQGWLYGEEWERGPAAASGGGGSGNPDPGEDHTGSDDNFVAGVVLGGTAQKTVHDFYWLTSPQVDTSNSQALRLAFWRFLNSDYLPYMQNRVQVFDGQGWTTVWETLSAPGIQDAKWTFVEYDIQQYANSLLQVRFGFMIGSNGVFTVSGWNVDDVMLLDWPEEGSTGLCCEWDSDCDGFGDAFLCAAGTCQDGP